MAPNITDSLRSRFFFGTFERLMREVQLYAQETHKCNPEKK